MGSELITFQLDPPKEYNWSIIDMDKLADCVAKHETSYCTSPNSPTANSRNNCWGIRPGGKLAYYNTIQEGKEAFISLWERLYGGIPSKRQAEIYSGMDKADDWYNNVNNCYSK